jgi:hypothetical protein
MKEQKNAKIGRTKENVACKREEWRKERKV